MLYHCCTKLLYLVQSWPGSQLKLHIVATVKIVLRQKQNKNGTFPLALRITKDRRASFIHLGQHIKESEWDADTQRVRKSHPNSTRLNNLLLKRLAEASDTSLELETQKGNVSSKAVKQKIKPSGGKTFFAQAKAYLDDLKSSGKYNRYTPDNSRLNNFKEFLKSEDVAFSDVTVSLLERFQVFLRQTKKIGERSIVNHLVVIRSVFSYAIKASVTDRKYYPFGAGLIRIKFPDTQKIGLNIEDVQALENTKLPEDSYAEHARKLWLFSFYFAGMRASDVLRLRWSDFQNDRLHYTMGKNLKSGSLKVPEKALAILKSYKAWGTKSNDLVFPELKRVENWDDRFVVERTIAFAISRIDKFLRMHVAPKAGIEKKLTMHIARHTFGNLSEDKIPIKMLQKLYRHSSITTTIGYQANFIHKDADEALDSVIGF